RQDRPGKNAPAQAHCTSQPATQATNRQPLPPHANAPKPTPAPAQTKTHGRGRRAHPPAIVAALTADVPQGFTLPDRRGALDNQLV
ncbi:hypothetical protein, partial [Stenotrophomonas sp. SrG]|uniref:hypothetical protein n=1 Tax=Stenotrophomonas sp. SrG TaxID=3414430 RepID=UPI003CFB3303